MVSGIGGRKILHILDHSLPIHSGYAFRSHAIFAAQQRLGYEPIVLTSPKHYASFRGEQVPQERVGNFVYYRTKGIPASSRSPRGELRLIWALAQRLNEVVERERPVLLHAHSPILNALPTLWIGRHTGLPVVYEMRSLWEDAAVNIGSYGRESLKYRLVRGLESWVCRHATQVTVLCEGLLRDLALRGIDREKLTIIPNGVDPDAFQPCEPDHEIRKQWNLADKKVIGFLGSFFKWEGLDLLIEAVARLRQTRFDVALLLVGGGDMESDLRKKIRHLQLENAVIMPGPIPQTRIPGIYSFIDILAYPRHSMRLTELVTPLKPLEAMAMGKALVASDVGGHRELIEDGKTGILFRAGDVTQLTEALNRLLDDSELRAKLGRQGLAWVRGERSWDKSVQGYARVYARALGQTCTAEQETVPRTH